MISIEKCKYNGLSAKRRDITMITYSESGYFRLWSLAFEINHCFLIRVLKRKFEPSVMILNVILTGVLL